MNTGFKSEHGVQNEGSVVNFVSTAFPLIPEAYSVFTPKENRKEFIHAALNPDAAPVGFQKSQAVQINGIYVSRHNHEAVVPPDFDHNGKKTPKKRGGKER